MSGGFNSPPQIEEGRAEAMGAAEGGDESEDSAGVVLINRISPLNNTTLALRATSPVTKMIVAKPHPLCFVS